MSTRQKKDTRFTNDGLRHNTVSMASTGINNPTDQKDGSNPDENFSSGGKNNLQPILNPKLSDCYRY